eukprot:2393744-Prymnesium_polylepis.1
MKAREADGRAMEQQRGVGARRVRQRLAHLPVVVFPKVQRHPQQPEVVGHQDTRVATCALVRVIDEAAAVKLARRRPKVVRVGLSGLGARKLRGG